MSEEEIKEIKKLEREVIKLHKEGLHSVTIAARTGFRAVDVREIIKEQEDRRIIYHFVPIELKDANRFIAQFHRHSKPVVRAKFQIGLMEDEELIGVGVVGRPIARLLSNGKTVEVLRTCIKEGHPNACSMMYARIKQISRILGYEKVITYTLQKESQSSLKALGASVVAEVKPQEWDRKDRRRTHQKVYNEPKYRWEL